MKKMVLASIGVAVLLFTGCSQKNPNVDMTTKNQKMEKTSNMNQNASSTMDANNMDADTMARQKADATKMLISDLEKNLKSVYFDFDKYNIKPTMQPVVQDDSGLLNSDKAQNLSIKIEGNCDEWGTDEYNYALGLKRAKAVKNELSTQGIDANRMMIISYGKSNPVCNDHTKACWSQNRRADLKLLP